MITEQDDPIAEDVLASGVPTVVLDTDMSAQGLDSVVLDNEKGTCARPWITCCGGWSRRRCTSRAGRPRTSTRSSGRERSPRCLRRGA